MRYISRDTFNNAQVAEFVDFVGSAADNYITRLIAATPSADRTLTLPNATGTLALTSGVGVTTLNGTTANGLTTYASAGTLDVEDTLTYNPSGLFHLSNNIFATLQITNTADNVNGGMIYLHNSKNGAAGDNGDITGKIVFQGMNNGAVSGTPAAQIYAIIAGKAADVTENTEAGSLEFYVTEYDGTSTTLGLKLDGDTNADGEIDVTIGAGVASLTTIAGDLALNGDTITSAADLNIVATGNDIDIDTDNLTITSATAQKPLVTIKSTTNDNKGSELRFVSDKGADGADGDYNGNITFFGDNIGEEQIYYGAIQSRVVTAADGDEASRLLFKVATSDDSTSTLTQGLDLFGHATTNDVSATIGSGATSTTKIAGTLMMGSTAFVNNSGVVQVATQGTIDHDSLANFVAAEHYDWSGDISGTATIHTNNITDLHGAGVNGSANQLLTDDGDGTVSSEVALVYDGNSLTIGSMLDTVAKKIVRQSAGADIDGADLEIYAGNARAGTGLNKPGGLLKLYTGGGTGTGTPGAFQIWQNQDGSGGTGQVAHTMTTQFTKSPGGTRFFIYEPSGTDYCSITVEPNGATTITTSDDAGSAANLTFDVDGDITFNADGGDFNFKDGSAILGKLDTNGLDFTDNLGAGIIFEGSTDDAHKTTLGVIDPTGTRAVNLPDTSGTVIVDTLVPHITNCGFNATSTSKLYLPFASGFYETSSPSNYNEYHTFCVPYDGYVDHVILRSENAPGSTVVGVHTTDTGTEAPSSTADATVTVDMAVDDTPYKFAFGDSTGVFTAGQSLVISADVAGGTNLGDCVATMFIKFNTTSGV